MMSGQHKPLASQSSFLVAVTRIADKAMLVVNSCRDLERAVQHNPGEKTAALEVSALIALPKRFLSLKLY
jgi:hypothetical protein